MEITQLFQQYAELQKVIDEFKAELPAGLIQAEKDAADLKKEIQNYAKQTGQEAFGSGYEVALSVRSSWDGKSLDGYAKAHPEIVDFKKETTVATVRKLK